MSEIYFSALLVFLTTAGQIFLKKGAICRGGRKRFFFIGMGYLLLLVTIICSYFLMKIIAMKYFVVIMSVNYISVMYSSRLFLAERLGRNKIIGTLLVAIGIFVFMTDPV